MSLRDMLSPGAWRMGHAYSGNFFRRRPRLGIPTKYPGANILPNKNQPSTNLVPTYYQPIYLLNLIRPETHTLPRAPCLGDLA